MTISQAALNTHFSFSPSSQINNKRKQKLPEKDAIKCDCLRQISASGDLRRVPEMVMTELSAYDVDIPFRPVNRPKGSVFPSVHFISSNYNVRLEILTYSTRTSRLEMINRTDLFGQDYPIIVTQVYVFHKICLLYQMDWGPTVVIHAECNC